MARKPTTRSGSKTINIRGVVLQKGPLFSDGPYGVYVGYIESDATKDIPHYLLVNMENEVIEGSSARLFEIRGMAEVFAKEVSTQNNLIEKHMALVARDEPNGNIDPDVEAQHRKWKGH